ncbi:DeoR/GlpR family DNA-binding transcription regulator [uncultured Pseudokineococcus sp.]|uniref:DeoR/GlpR family DNA-binding transcription regulator n=1 Tax=uncultured Pseudokineococcus sp. TaxID=1642928 RepID=UPI002631AB04|nr:DeoR/GlpR family DNA-binding transcription regulator [uncultured Pseudokineococcus sp.]
MKQQRLARILDMVAQDGHVTLAQVRAELGTSVATARRDLDALAQQRLVVRTHGGASALASSGYERPLADKAAVHAEAKGAIARATCDLIAVGDVVGVNGGTTTTEVARELARADHLAPADGTRGFTLVTNALNIAFELAVRPHATVVMSGGTVRPRSFELSGPAARTSLQEVVLDVAVLGVDGVDARFGATTADAGEADIGRTLADAARRVVVVADSSKHGRTGPQRLLDLDRVDVLVTERAPGAPLARALAEAGVRLVLAPPAPG